MWNHHKKNGGTHCVTCPSTCFSSGYEEEEAIGYIRVAETQRQILSELSWLWGQGLEPSRRVLAEAERREAVLRARYS